MSELRSSFLLQRMGPPIFLGLLFTWALVIHLRFVLKYSYPIPYWDESGFIPYITKFRPVTIEWLWSQANEHRIVIHRLIYLLVVKIAGLDSRVLNSITLLLLAGTAVGTLWCLARARGPLTYSDGFVVLLLLHRGHHPNTLWPIQLGFVLVTCLVCAAVLLISFSEHTERPRVIVAIGVIVLVMCLCGAHGLPSAALFSLFLVITAIRLWKKDRRLAKLSLAFAITSYVLLILYFVGYTRIPLRGRPVSFWDKVVESLKALSISMGPYASKLWPYAGILVGAISLTMMVLLIKRLREADEWEKPAGLLLGMLAMCALALEIGFGRAILGNDAGFASRYATFLTPLMLMIYLFFRRFDDGQIGKLARMVLLGGAAALFVPNGRFEAEDVEAKYSDGETLVEKVRAGTPIRKLAIDYGPRWMFTPEIFEEYMRMLASSRLGIYRRYPPPVEAGDAPRLK